MSNWYNTNTTDTWFSANEVGAWTPTLTATTPAPAKPSSNIKVMKQQPQQTAMKNWTESKQMNKKLRKMELRYHLKLEPSNFMNYLLIPGRTRELGMSILLRMKLFRIRYSVRRNLLRKNSSADGILQHPL